MKKITLISGSLRKDSYNTKLLEEIKKYVPENYEVSLLDYSSLPLFNEEIEAEVHPKIADLKNQIASSDLIFMATPAYNNSYSGVLKNAIDWFSRPSNVFSNKPVAILGATMGMAGTIVAQEHLASVLDYMGAYVMPKPRVYVSSVYNYNAEDGGLNFPTELNEMIKTFVDEAIIFEQKINSNIN